MKVAVGVLTYEPRKLGRLALLDETLVSVKAAFPSATRLVFENGSRHPDARAAAERHGYAYEAQPYSNALDANTTPGRGRNLMLEALLRDGPDLVVFSDDDVAWKPEAQHVLEIFWRAAGTSTLSLSELARMPEEKPCRSSKVSIVLLSGLLEPEWHWNVPLRADDRDGVRVLVRESCPAAAWSFLAQDAAKFFPLVEDFGEDVDACRRLRRKGYEVAEVDLATHLGEKLSSHGNKSSERGKPLDRAKWGGGV